MPVDPSVLVHITRPFLFFIPYLSLLCYSIIGWTESDQIIWYRRLPLQIDIVIPRTFYHGYLSKSFQKLLVLTIVVRSSLCGFLFFKSAFLLYLMPWYTLSLVPLFVIFTSACITETSYRYIETPLSIALKTNENSYEKTMVIPQVFTNTLKTVWSECVPRIIQALGRERKREGERERGERERERGIIHSSAPRFIPNESNMKRVSYWANPSNILLYFTSWTTEKIPGLTLSNECGENALCRRACLLHADQPSGVWRKL